MGYFTHPIRRKRAILIIIMSTIKDIVIEIFLGMILCTRETNIVEGYRRHKQQCCRFLNTEHTFPTARNGANARNASYTLFYSVRFGPFAPSDLSFSNEDDSNCPLFSTKGHILILDKKSAPSNERQEWRHLYYILVFILALIF